MARPFPTQELAMTHSVALSNLSPAIIVHMIFAIAALLLGPLALLARKGSRPHRAFGYAWVTLMLGAALSSAFIRSFNLPNIAGYTPIHLFSVFAVAIIALALVYIARRNLRGHQRAMRGVYIGACVAAAFAFLPGRTLGDLVWHHALGVI
jgi:uncharacterized membrane protein